MFLKSKRDALEQRERILQYRRVFGSEEGQMILRDLMNNFHILNSHKGDMFKEGQRSVVLHILNQNNVDINEYDKLIKGEGFNNE